uniref:Uncharacterized protein n=1 Tax=Oryza barthii TaxID=65489 RepID=A0A0D3F5Z2_9ORYZ
MVMAEVVASEKLSGAGSMRRRRTSALGRSALASGKKLPWTSVGGQRCSGGPHRRGPRGDDSGKSNPVRGGAPGGNGTEVVFGGGADRR